jgi:hypothetical protein
MAFLRERSPFTAKFVSIKKLPNKFIVLNIFDILHIEMKTSLLKILCIAAEEWE